MQYFKMLALRSSPSGTATKPSTEFTGKKILAVVHLSVQNSLQWGNMYCTPLPCCESSLVAVISSNDEALLSKNIKPMPTNLVISN